VTVEYAPLASRNGRCLAAGAAFQAGDFNTAKLGRVRKPLGVTRSGPSGGSAFGLSNRRFEYSNVWLHGRNYHFANNGVCHFPNSRCASYVPRRR
jgi:hypothetical protein